jgi:hypothetical protein
MAQQVERLYAALADRYRIERGPGSGGTAGAQSGYGLEN